MPYTMMLLFSTIAVCLAVATPTYAQAQYGLDCSFPIHSKELKCGNLLGDRKAAYEEFMQGCRDFYGKKGDRCDSIEDDRIEMSKRQPQSMVNYTSTGFKKIKAPLDVWKLLREHWERNKDQQKAEVWPAGNVYTNHWAAPTYMVSVEDQNLRGTGGLKNKIWEAAKSTIQDWTGMELKPTSMYGIRVYTEGAVLNPHVDRLPLVSSAIINVAQDVDEPWVLEVYDRHDQAVNVTMEPGDMVLYESGSLMHGRPFPMKGRYYANIFIHFEPTGRTLDGKSVLDEENDFFPPYIQNDSPEIENWLSRNPYGWKKPSPSATEVYTPEGHAAAQQGDIKWLQAINAKNSKLLHMKDSNGWMPIHEAARAGQFEAIKLLDGYGGDLSARTLGGKGHTPLALARESLSEAHPVVEYLKSRGAVDLRPDEL